eukprot:NODE_105_length_19280_cov_0.929461.p1 type:complete len:1375 gc:universal NODE_105_length_19280_cov_0.929461:7419-11543(+)
MNRTSIINDQVWISHKEEGYLLVKVEKKSDEGIHYSISNKQFSTKEFYPHNPSLLNTISDLCMLSYLHEPAILYTLKQRYLQQNIYTWSGLVLIAINPFKSLPIYGNNMVSTYQNTHENLDPHIFMIAKTSYDGLSLQNQSIIVSGESGAGKTQSAKYLMKYITGQNTSELSDVESAVLATNPLTESFGNAKTVRNDNSSRFGKYLEMLFVREDDQFKIVGAKMSTFLLERSRIVYQPTNERNYHIFYQLLKGCALAERKQLYLPNVTDMKYIKTCTHIDNVDDQAEFNLTQKAFSQIGISVSMQWKVFQVLAGILHLGNTEFGNVVVNDVTLDDSRVMDDDAHPNLGYACELLGLDKELFKKHLTTRTIHMRSEKIEKPLLKQEANIVKDAVSKYIYTNLFDWLIQQINYALAPNAKGSYFIGILDIFGFEHFKRNSFEQFCINYANEKLQQEFNQHVFKVEQQRYVDEGIEWQFIDFQDNQPCIDLIEDKVGVLSILDEEVLLPSGNDSSFINKLYMQFHDAAAPKSNKKAYFGKPKFGQESFVIKHYAIDVEYHMEGFIDKNKDSIADEIVQVLARSTNELLKEMLHLKQQDTSTKKRSTLGSTFKSSLIDLMKTIQSTNVSYVRCIKPNASKQAFEYDPLMVLSQLRACGVLETIRISSAGYPGRMDYDEFVSRYYLLTSFKHRQLPKMELIKTILVKVLDDEKRSDKFTSQQGKVDLYQLGKTKIFFRAGELAYMERSRDKRLRQAAIMLQKNMKCMIYKKKFDNKRALTIKAQSYARRYIARQRVKKMRVLAAAITIQSMCRMFLKRKQFLTLRIASLYIQTQFRAYKVRRRFANKKKEFSAMKIQRVYRGHLARKDYKRELKLIIFLQSCIRRRYAYRELKQLRIEAKSANHFKDVSYKLENKVVQLTQANQTKDQLIKELQDKLAASENNCLSWKERYTKLEVQSKSTAKGGKALNEQDHKKFVEVEKRCKQLTESAAEYLSKLSLIENESKAIKAENEKLKRDKDHVEQQLQTQIDKLTNINLLQQQVNTLKTQLHKMNDDEYEETLPFSPITAEDKGHVMTNTLFGTNINSSTQKLDEESPEALQLTQIKDLLKNPQLESELLKNFINLRIPDIPPFILNLPNIWDITSSETVQSRKESLFPAHTLCVYLIKKWQLGLATKSFNTILKQIEDKLETDSFRTLSFWTSNLFEMSCIVKSVKLQKNRMTKSLDAQTANLKRDVTDLSESGKEILKIQNEMERIFLKGFQKLYSFLRQRFQKYAIPSILENQSLPGFVTKDDGGFFQRLGYSSSEKHSVEDLIENLTENVRMLKGYAMDDLIVAQIFGEIIRLLGIEAFNHLLMRRGFSTWKRGLLDLYRNANSVQC